MSYKYLFIDNKYLELSTKELVNILKEADKAYHELGNPILDDNEYDLIKDRLLFKAPKNPYFKRVGFKPIDKNKIKLPFYLGSQNKIKYGNVKEIESWFKKFNEPHEYIISEKLDGISCLIYNKDGDIHIYTRGDGIEGIDISYIKDYIQTIPKEIPIGLAIRGELLLNKKNWEKVKEYGANPRNLVAGIINSKTINKKILPLIDFTIYDILDEKHRDIPLNMYKYAISIGFKVAYYEIYKKKLTNDELFNILKRFKENSEYEIDGIVITHNTYNKLKNNKNPEYSYAFKSNLLLDEAIVNVESVEWNISKDGYLKPIVKFNPVNLNGVVIKQATGFNGDYIYKNKIGKGSVIKIQRSGDVIPHIISIIKAADNGNAMMPDIPYKWNKTHIDIIKDDEDNKNGNREQDIKIYTFFMKSLKIKGISEGIITKLYDNSFTTLYKIINIKKEDLLNIEGFKEKSSLNIINALKEIRNKSCMDIMIASNIMGRGLGEKKLEMIYAKYPYICEDKMKGMKLKEEEIKEIAGMGELSSKQFIDNLNKFYKFYEDMGFKLEKKEDKEKTKEDKKGYNDKIVGNYYVFTGFRSEEIKKYIRDNKGYVDDNIMKRTTHLIVKDKTKITDKIIKAEEKGIKIIAKDEFDKIIYHE